MNKYFKNIPHIGDLYLDFIFLNYETDPILFTCIDRHKSLFLCLCCEVRSIRKWIITRCDNDTLKKLIENKIDIKTALCADKKFIVATMDLSGQIVYQNVSEEDIDPLDLPDGNIYLKENYE